MGSDAREASSQDLGGFPEEGFGESVCVVSDGVVRRFAMERRLCAQVTPPVRATVRAIPMPRIHWSPALWAHASRASVPPIARQ